MHVPYFFATSDLLYVWDKATPEAKVIIVTLVIFSIFAWSVMESKAVQMRHAKSPTRLLKAEFRRQKNVLEIYNRRLQGPICLLLVVYWEGSRELDARL